MTTAAYLKAKHVSSHVLLEPTIVIIEVEKSVIVIVSLWSDDMDIRPIEFLETVTLEVLMKETVHFDQLRH